MGRKKADCRKCIHFIPFDKLDDHLKEVACVQAAKWFRKDPLGWCRKRDSVITYYEGTCRFFSRKPEKYRTLDGREIIWYGT